MGRASERIFPLARVSLLFLCFGVGSGVLCGGATSLSLWCASRRLDCKHWCESYLCCRVGSGVGVGMSWRSPIGRPILAGWLPCEKLGDPKGQLRRLSKPLQVQLPTMRDAELACIWRLRAFDRSRCVSVLASVSCSVDVTNSFPGALGSDCTSRK